MTKLGDAYVDVDGKFDKLVDGLNKQVDGIKGSFGKMFGGIAAGATAAFGAVQVGQFLGDAISQYQESAKVGRLTEQVIRSTGGAAQVSAGQVSELATALSNKSGIDDEVIQSGENVLLTFTNVKNAVGAGNDVFNQASEAALNMSAALGTDLQGSTIQLGKALNDPIQGMSALSRVGVSFTDQQKAQIEALQKSGDLLGAQKIILGELNTEFGGAAAAAADPLQKLSVTFGNLKEDIGGALFPIVEKIAPLLQSVLPAIGTALTTAIGPLVDAVGPLLVSLVPIIQTIAGAIASVIQGMAPALAALAPVFASLGPILGGVAQSFAPLIASIGQLAAQVLPILTPIFQILGPIIGMIADALTPIIGTLGTALGGLVQTLGPILIQVFTALRPGMSALLTAISAIAQALLGGLGTALQAILPPIGKIATIFAGVLSKVLVALAPVIARLATLLGDILGKVFVAIAPLLGTIADTFGILAGQLIDALMPILPPLLDVMMKLLEAILPILPPLIQMVATILPPLISLLMLVMAPVTALATAFSEKLGGALEWLSEKMGGFKDLVAGVVNGVIDLVNKGIGFINRTFQLHFKVDVPDWLPGPSQLKFDWDGPNIKTIPKLHSGGFFEAPFGQSEGLALLRNGELVSTPEQLAQGAGRGGVQIGNIYAWNATEAARALADEVAFARLTGAA